MTSVLGGLALSRIRMANPKTPGRRGTPLIVVAHPETLNPRWQLARDQRALGGVPPSGRIGML